MPSLIPRPLLRTTLLAFRQFKCVPFERRLPQASEHQRAWLLNRIQRCRDTEFGKAHHFGSIQNLNQFRHQVPVAEYEYFAPYINKVAQGNTEALLPSDDRLLQFTITTGSTGVPKLNPVTQTWLKEYKAGWDIWGIQLFLDHPNQLGHRILQMAGTWDMGQTDGGYQISMVSALLARRQSLLLRPFYALPEIINTIPDPVARHYVALRLCIAESIGWIILMNPGSLIRLAEVGDHFKSEMIRDVADGTLTNALEIPEHVRVVLSKYCSRPNQTAGQRLESIANTTGHLRPKDYWNEPVIGCWLGGTAGFQSQYLHEFFGNSPMRDLGLVSSEGRHTIPLADTLPQGVPAVGAGFYEFVPVDEGSSPAAVLEGHELQEGQDYRLLITNSAGYFRFDIGDIVRCKGFSGQAPLLEFRQKASRVGDLEGEKMTEHQIVEGTERAARKCGVQLGLFTVVPSRHAIHGQRYEFLMEISDVPDSTVARQFLTQIDQELAELNFLWRNRRKEGVIGQPVLHRLAEKTWDTYIRQETERRGTGDFQYKHPALVIQQEWGLQFSPLDTISMA